MIGKLLYVVDAAGYAYVTIVSDRFGRHDEHQLSPVFVAPNQLLVVSLMEKDDLRGQVYLAQAAKATTR